MTDDSLNSQYSVDGAANGLKSNNCNAGLFVLSYPVPQSQAQLKWLVVVSCRLWDGGDSWLFYNERRQSRLAAAQWLDDQYWDPEEKQEQQTNRDPNPPGLTGHGGGQFTAWHLDIRYVTEIQSGNVWHKWLGAQSGVLVRVQSDRGIRLNWKSWTFLKSIFISILFLTSFFSKTKYLR